VTEAEIVRKCLSRIDAQVRRRAAMNDGGGQRADANILLVCWVADHSARSWSSATTRLCTAAMHLCSSLWALIAKRSAATPRRRSPSMWYSPLGWLQAGRYGR